MRTMSLCETCIHVVTDGKKPVACMALVKYIKRDSCMFYKENPFLSGKNPSRIYYYGVWR